MQVRTQLFLMMHLKHVFMVTETSDITLRPGKMQTPEQDTLAGNHGLSSWMEWAE